jgi:tRNA (guanine-N7-)-methyltransferase
VGEVIGSLAENNPHIDYLGIEVHRRAWGACCCARHRRVQLARHLPRCRRGAEGQDSDGSFDEILVFFPDPWHKKRHHKRRLIDPAFVDLAAAKLRAGGVLRLATDWQAYAEQMLAVCNANPRI